MIWKLDWPGERSEFGGSEIERHLLQTYSFLGVIGFRSNSCTRKGFIFSLRLCEVELRWWRVKRRCHFFSFLFLFSSLAPGALVKGIFHIHY